GLRMASSSGLARGITDTMARARSMVRGSVPATTDRASFGLDSTVGGMVTTDTVTRGNSIGDAIACEATHGRCSVGFATTKSETAGRNTCQPFDFSRPLYSTQTPSSLG